MKERIFVTHELPGDFLNSLRDKYEVEVWPERDIAREDLLERVRGVSGILCLLTEKIDREVMEAAGKDLKVIANYAVGYDNIDIKEATQRGIVVANTPGVLEEAVGEHVIALALAVGRRVMEGDRLIREGKYKGWEPDLLVGTSLRGKVMGIIGMGRIGQWTAKLACGMGMRTVYFSRHQETDFEAKCAVDYLPFEEVLQEADVLSLNVPLNDETRGMIGEKELKMMKNTALVINTARGGVINEKALIKALREEQIGGAGLDVFEDEEHVNEELFQFSNVVLTPHIASATKEARLQMAKLAVGAIETVLDGGRPANMVR